jgi:hypothetical protein
VLRCSWVAAVAMLVVQLTSGQTLGPAAPDQIEAEWQIIIATPDPAGGGPQLSISMSPVADGSTPFFIFNLNYIDSPVYIPGGMQMQVWSGTQLVAATSKG